MILMMKIRTSAKKKKRKQPFPLSISKEKRHRELWWCYLPSISLTNIRWVFGWCYMEDAEYEEDGEDQE